MATHAVEKSLFVGLKTSAIGLLLVLKLFPYIGGLMRALRLGAIFAALSLCEPALLPARRTCEFKWGIEFVGVNGVACRVCRCPQHRVLALRR